MRNPVPPMTTEPSPLRTLVAMPDYRRLWLIGAGVGIARWLEFLALGVFAWQVTGSASLVALLAIVRMGPYVLFGFAVGALADFLDRKRLLVAAFVLSTLAAVAFAGLVLTGHAGYPLAIVAAGVSGFVWTTDMPVRRRLMVEKAGPERMAAALGFDNSTAYATRAIGPVTGGIVYESLGLEGVFAISALVYALCACWALRLEPEARDGAAARPSILALLIPPRAIVTDPAFQVVLGVTAVYNLWCFPFITMVPVIAQKDFTLTPALVGLLSACDGIGGTLGAIAIGFLGSGRTLFRTYFWGTLVFLCIVLALSAWLTPPTTALGLLALGAAAACFSATQYALVYTIAPAAMRGRATGFLSLFIGLSTLGFYNTGWLFQTYPSVEAMRILALQGLVPMLVLGLLWLRVGRQGPRA
jgi:MFS family permease